MTRSRSCLVLLALLPPPAAALPPAPAEVRTPAEAALGPPAAPALCTPDAPIARIVIERVSVFDLGDDGGRLRGLYRAANVLHRPMQTRPRTIRRLLSIREGDRCDPEALEEAERILRGYVFVQDAWVEPIDRDEAGVVVRVRIQDAWSTRVRLSARNQGGASKTTFGVREVNLLGTGSQLQWTTGSDQDRRETVFTYLDPAIGRSRWRLLARYGDNSDGVARELEFGKPFYELDGRREFLIDADSLQHEEKVYVGDAIADVWRGERRRFALTYGWSRNGLVDDRVARWFVRAGLQDIHWSPADPSVPVARPDLAPLDRDQIWAGAGRSWQWIDYRRVSLIDTGRRIEDLDLSRRIEVALRIAAGRGSAASGGGLEISAGDGFELWRDGYLQLGLHHETERLGDRFIDAVTTFTGRLVSKPSPLTAVNVELRAARGDALEGPRRFLAGGDTGLRGYPSRAFSGDRFLLARVELRYFAPWYLGKLLRLGLVGFAEAGGAWDHGTRFSRGVLHPDVGIGLRGYIKPSSGGTTLHLNAAYPLDREVSGRRFGLQVSFLAARTF